MRIPTKDELVRRKAFPEEDFWVAKDGPTNLDDLVDVDVTNLLESRGSFEYRLELSGYYGKFIWWAKQSPQEADQRVWPQLAGVELPDPEEYSLTINPLEDDTVIEGRIEAFRKRVLEDARRKREGVPTGWMTFFMTQYARDPRGVLKKPTEVFAMLEDALNVKRFYSESGATYASVASEMGWAEDSHDKRKCDAAEKRVRLLLKKADALIAATLQGTFLDELNKPLS